MKKPRIADFDPAAAERELGSPLDDMPAIKPPAKKAPVTAVPEIQNANKPKKREASSLHANLQPGRTVNGQLPKNDKFDKYSTYLRPGYKKELKMIALEKDCKDYEVLDEALTMYIETLKK